MSYRWTISTTWWEAARVMMPMGMANSLIAMKMVMAQLGVRMGFHAGSSCCVNSVCLSSWNMVCRSRVRIDDSALPSSSSSFTSELDDGSPFNHWFGVEDDAPLLSFTVDSAEPLSRVILPSIPTTSVTFCKASGNSNEIEVLAELVRIHNLP